MKNFRYFSAFVIFCFFINTNGFSANYYWVGGSGNWSDAAHWSSTSGGSGGAGAPGSVDNVFFDANSGFTAMSKTVTVDLTNTSCRDMNWTGALNNPVMAGSSSNSLRIYGSLTLIAAMSVSFSGPIYFEANTSGKTISTPGKAFTQAIYFNGGGGSWTLLDSLHTSNTIYLYYGTLNTNNHNLTAQKLDAYTSNTRALNLGSSVVKLKGNGWPWWSPGSNFTFNAGTSNVIFSGNTDPGIYTNMTMNFYNVTATSPTATLKNNSGYNFNFHSLILMGGCELYGTNTYFDLQMTPGKIYRFESAKTHTISNSLTISPGGGCTAYTTIQAITAGSQFTFQKSSGTVTLDFVMLRDSKTMGTTFIANNAVDMGNNSGWTINLTPPRNLYWVGNGGNWNDQSHWSLSSGGTGGECAPSSSDNVFFDANSFTLTGQTLNINITNALCKDMSWTGVLNNPALAGSSSNALKIYGSLNFIQAMTVSYSGPVYFEAGSPGKTINTAGKIFSQAFYFNGGGGGWTLQDSLVTSNTIYLYYGTLNTNGHNLTAQKLDAYTSNPRTLNLSSSVVKLKGNGWPWWSPGSNFTFNAGASHIIFSGNTDPGIYTNMTMNFYDVSATSPTATLKNNSGYNMNFHTLTLLGGCELYGTNSYYDFNMTPGKIYKFESGKIHTITNSMSISSGGSCVAYTTILAITSGSQFTFQKSSGTVTLDFVALRDVKAQGTTFIANNAVDMGNNSGWTLNTTPPRNLYWVGNSGNWNDQAHWSLSSGGPGGECPPSSNDNVFFDANSFILSGQTVNINITNALCKNMDWTGALNNPVLAGTSTNALRIYGSLTFIQPMSVSYSGPIYFEANTTGKTLATAGKTFSQAIYFTGGGGGWTLQDSLNTNNTVYLFYGTLNTNGQNLTAQKLDAYTSNARTLNLGNSVIKLKGNGWPWWTPGSNFTFNAGTSHIIFSGNSDPGIYTNMTMNFYDVTATSGSATLKNNSGYNMNFHTLTLLGGCQLSGNNSYQNLMLTAGKINLFESSKTQTVYNTFSAYGLAGQLIDIKSITSGSPATISRGSGMVCCDYLQIKDIAVTGGAQFYAGTHSINISGNTGWLWAGCLSCPPLTATLSGGSSPVCHGAVPAPFAVTAAGGDGIYTYLWFLNGLSTGITTSTYTAPALTADATVYCQVSSCQQAPETINTSTYTVLIETTPPAISCPADIAVNINPGECDALVNYSTPLGTDNCPGAVTVQTAGLPGGSSFPEGVTTNTFVVTDANNSSAACSFTVTANLVARTLNLIVYLEGLFNGTAMNTAMDYDSNSNLVPKWGAGIADTFFVEFHDAANYNNIVHVEKNIDLHTDGTAQVFIPAAFSGSYYITIRHRNHLETPSALPQSFSSCSQNYDFTTGAAAAYGNNMGMTGSKSVIYAGELSSPMYSYPGLPAQDGIIDLSDVSYAFNSYLNGDFGYEYASDINSDGTVDLLDIYFSFNNYLLSIFAILP